MKMSNMQQKILAIDPTPGGVGVNSIQQDRKDQKLTPLFTYLQIGPLGLLFFREYLDLICKYERSIPNILYSYNQVNFPSADGEDINANLISFGDFYSCSYSVASFLESLGFGYGDVAGNFYLVQSNFQLWRASNFDKDQIQGLFFPIAGRFIFISKSIIGNFNSYFILKFNGYKFING